MSTRRRCNGIRTSRATRWCSGEGGVGEDVQISRRESLTADSKPGHQLAPTAATVPPPHGQDMHDSELRMGARDRARAKNQARTACTALPTRAAR
jgi:hypothetical protein